MSNERDNSLINVCEFLFRLRGDAEEAEKKAGDQFAATRIIAIDQLLTAMSDQENAQTEYRKAVDAAKKLFVKWEAAQKFTTNAVQFLNDMYGTTMLNPPTERVARPSIPLDPNGETKRHSIWEPPETSPKKTSDPETKTECPVHVTAPRRAIRQLTDPPRPDPRAPTPTSPILAPVRHHPIEGMENIASLDDEEEPH